MEIKFDRCKKNYCAGCMGKRLVIQTTTACNGKCKFCVAVHNINEGKKNVIELADIANQYPDYKHILILGGESMLFPNDVVKLVTKLMLDDPKRKITINTNGTNLEALIPIANFLDKVIVSIMHWNEDKNKEIMGIVANYNPVKEMAKINPNLKLRINCVVHKSGVHTLNDIASMAMFAKANGFNSIKFSEMTTENKADPDFIDLQNLFKENNDIHQFDTVTHGCYLEPKSLLKEYGIKTILNLTCNLKCLAKQNQFIGKEYKPMVYDSLYISPKGHVTKSFYSSEDKANDRGAC